MTNNNIIAERVFHNENIEEVAIRCLSLANSSGKPVCFTLANVQMLVYPETLVKDIVYEWRQKRKILTDKNKKITQIINKTGRTVVLKTDEKTFILRSVENPIRCFICENNFKIAQGTEAGDIWIYRSDSWFENLPPAISNTFYIVDLETYHHLKIEHPDRKDFIFVCGEKKVGTKYLVGKYLSTELSC